MQAEASQASAEHRHVTHVKTIGIALFDGFALPEIASIMEVFQYANEFTALGEDSSPRFKLCLLSTAGGRIASSSSVFVWTDSIQARRHPERFDALFIAGGPDVDRALCDGELLAWLLHVCPMTEHVVPVGEGHLLLEAADDRRSVSAELAAEKSPYRAAVRDGRASPLRSALMLIEEELGPHVARQIAAVVSPSASTQFTDIVHRNGTRSVSEKIQASARWLEQNGHRQVGIDEAARFAAMSERNFLRRFKAELGVTPSDYLLYVRLDMCCRLLAETTLPVDKIARRCGIGSGGQLSKLFRKYLATTPTDYRLRNQAAF